MKVYFSFFEALFCGAKRDPSNPNAENDQLYMGDRLCLYDVKLETPEPTDGRNFGTYWPVHGVNFDEHFVGGWLGNVDIVETQGGKRSVVLVDSIGTHGREHGPTRTRWARAKSLPGALCWCTTRNQHRSAQSGIASG